MRMHVMRHPVIFTCGLLASAVLAEGRALAFNPTAYSSQGPSPQNGILESCYDMQRDIEYILFFQAGSTMSQSTPLILAHTIANGWTLHEYISSPVFQTGTGRVLCYFDTNDVGHLTFVSTAGGSEPPSSYILVDAYGTNLYGGMRLNNITQSGQFINGEPSPARPPQLGYLTGYYGAGAAHIYYRDQGWNGSNWIHHSYNVTASPGWYTEPVIGNVIGTGMTGLYDALGINHVFFNGMSNGSSTDLYELYYSGAWYLGDAFPGSTTSPFNNLVSHTFNDTDLEDILGAVGTNDLFDQSFIGPPYYAWSQSGSYAPNFTDKSAIVDETNPNSAGFEVAYVGTNQQLYWIGDGTSPVNLTTQYNATPPAFNAEGNPAPITGYYETLHNFYHIFYIGTDGLIYEFYTSDPTGTWNYHVLNGVYPINDPALP